MFGPQVTDALSSSILVAAATIIWLSRIAFGSPKPIGEVSSLSYRNGCKVLTSWPSFFHGSSAHLMTLPSTNQISASSSSVIFSSGTSPPQSCSVWPSILPYQASTWYFWLSAFISLTLAFTPMMRSSCSYSRGL